MEIRLNTYELLSLLDLSLKVLILLFCKIFLTEETQIQKQSII